MSYPKLTPIIAKGASEPRYLEDRFADKINVKDFGAVGDGETDDRDALYEALKVFFNNPTKYKVLDLNGYNLTLKSDIVIRFGDDEGDFPTRQSYLGDTARGLCICNGMLTWDGGNSSSYMIDIGTNTAKSPEAELVDFKFHNVTFNAQQNSKNLVKVFNFYDLYFSQCTFANFNDAVAVFLPSTDDNNVYCDDNGATFWDCRWYDLPAKLEANTNKATMADLGTPILSYCGDLVVSRGFSEWCGPFDFHIGSILFEGFHWSSGIGNAETLTRCAVFRDPREIQIRGCDIDQGTFLFTTEGYFGGTEQNANKNWSQISIKDNKFIASTLPATGEGLVNFKVTNLDTSFYGVSISGNAASAYIKNNSNNTIDNAVDFIKVINGNSDYADYLEDPTQYLTDNNLTSETAPKLISAIRALYQYVDAYGMTPGDTDFGKSTFSVSNARVIYADEIDIKADYIGVAEKTVLSGDKLRLKSTVSVENDGSDGIAVKTASTSRWEFVSNGVFRPATDNAYSVGGAFKRPSVIYAATGSIDTSDAREKTGIVQPSEALMQAWGKVRFKVFQFVSSVEEKGADNARLHVGVIAQEVAEAFASEGLDASRYGLFCYDEWEDEYRNVEVVDAEAVLDASGREIEPAQTHVERHLVMSAGNRYAIRYGEALALECAYQRWRLEQLEERINQLTNSNN